MGGKKYVYVGREGHVCGREEVCVCGEGRPRVWEGRSMCMWGGKATCVGGEKYVYVGREGHVCGRGEVCVCGEGRPRVWEGRSMCIGEEKSVCGRVEEVQRYEEGDTVSDHAQYKNSLVGLS